MIGQPASGPGRAPRRFTFVRHGESTYNVASLLNGDPTVDVPLTDHGRSQVRAVASWLAGVPFDRAVCTGFPRTRETLGIILGGHASPPAIEVVAELDDIRVGVYEGRPVQEYRAWRTTHRPGDAPPGGESRIAALARYGAGVRRLLAAPQREVLVVAHDVTLRFLVNASRGADPLNGPVMHIRNGEVRAFHGEELVEALAAIERRLRAG